jgi:hypothetical protein
LYVKLGQTTQDEIGAQTSDCLSHLLIRSTTKAKPSYRYSFPNDPLNESDQVNICWRNIAISLIVAWNRKIHLMQIHSRKKRFAQRKADALTAAKHLMQRIVERTLDPWEGYRQIVGIFQGHAHLQMPELRSFVRIDDIDPNGCVSVTPEMRHSIFRRAEAFLAEHNEVPPADQSGTER